MQQTRARTIDEIASQVVKDLATDAGRSQAEVASFLEISQSALSLRFSRGYTWPLSELVRLAHWLGRDVLREIARESNRSAANR